MRDDDEAGSDDLGELIRLIRWARGWSQAKLARRTGIDRGQINRYESGKDKPRPATFHASTRRIPPLVPSAHPKGSRPRCRGAGAAAGSGRGSGRDAKRGLDRRGPDVVHGSGGAGALTQHSGPPIQARRQSRTSSRRMLSWNG